MLTDSRIVFCFLVDTSMPAEAAQDVNTGDEASGRDRNLSRSKAKRKTRPVKVEKSRRTSYLIFAGVIIVAVLIGLYVFSQPAKPAGSIGEFAPDFQLQVVTAQGLADEEVRLSSFRGKVVVLEFMVSWCHVCQQMAPSIAYLEQQYRGQDVVFLSVAATQGGATAESTAAFIRDNGVTWTHVLDSDNSVFSRYGVGATPTYYVIDRSGKIFTKFQGLVATDAISDAVTVALSS